MAIALNKKSVLASALVAGALLAGLAVAPATFAADTSATTGAAATAKDETAHGTASIDVVGGDRTLDHVAGEDSTTTLNFGQVNLNDLIGVEAGVTKTADLPKGTFQVTDNSGNKAGWQLSAAVENMKASATEKFDGKLTLNGQPLTADDTEKTGAVIYTSTDRGLWVNPALTKGASITVPQTADTGHYSADILYTLSNGTANA